MRVDITQREVGSFFGGREMSSRSMLCPKCGKPGLLIKNPINRHGRRTPHISHGFELKLNETSDPEVVWDTQCIGSKASPDPEAS